MKKTAKKNKASRKENTSGSSERQISEEQVSVNVPADIKHPKYARAYAHGFIAARSGKYLDFVAPAYRWAIARGWKDGEKAREAAHIEAQAEQDAHEAAMEAAPF